MSWQKILSTLASDSLPEAYARAVLGQQLDARSKERIRLTEAGLLLDDGSVNGGIFQETLAAAAPPRPRGVSRFFREGQLEALPAGHDDRLSVLDHLARRLFPADRELDEPLVNLLLATVTGDVPSLRRALVDYGYLERNADGTGYRRVQAD